MRLSSKAVALAGVVSLAINVGAVDIGSFEEFNCDWSELQGNCPDQPERTCCGFPSTLTVTISVGWRGLSEGDIATWFHSSMHGSTYNYCGGVRRSQVMMGSAPGIVCMSERDNHPLVSNDGANWQASRPLFPILDTNPDL
jgi:hypothetical protein